jgi:hypothetical protein
MSEDAATRRAPAAGRSQAPPRYRLCPRPRGPTQHLGRNHSPCVLRSLRSPPSSFAPPLAAPICTTPSAADAMLPGAPSPSPALSRLAVPSPLAAPRAFPPQVPRVLRLPVLPEFRPTILAWPRLLLMIQAWAATAGVTAGVTAAGSIRDSAWGTTTAFPTAIPAPSSPILITQSAARATSCSTTRRASADRRNS